MSGRFRYPRPLLDRTERSLPPRLRKQFESLTASAEPALWTRPLRDLGRAGGAVARAVRERLGSETLDTLVELAASDELDGLLARAGRVVEGLSTGLSRAVLVPEVAASNLRDAGLPLARFEEICALRFHRIAALVDRRSTANLAAAAAQGALTGAAGVAGVPLGVVVSSLLYLRCVQDIALHFGYDTARDLGELAVAAAVAEVALVPAAGARRSERAAIVAASMSVAGAGAELGAAAATDDPGIGGRAADSAESRFLGELVRALGWHASRVGGRALPLLGAIIASVDDTYTMRRLFRVATLIYHLRFLTEKADRVDGLRAARRRRLRPRS